MSPSANVQLISPLLTPRTPAHIGLPGLASEPASSERERAADHDRQEAPLKLVSVSSTPANRAADRRRYEALAAHSDIDVTLVVPRIGQSELPRGAAPSSGLRIRVEPVRFRSVISTRWHLHTFPRLGALLREERPDVLHVLGEPSSFVALQAARLRDSCAPGAALVIETDGTELRHLSMPFRLIERLVLKRTDALLARHRDALEAARFAGFTGQGMLINHGVDRTVFRPGYREEARALFGAEGVNVGFIGRLIPENGLIEILEALAAARSEITLLIMGAGPMRDELGDRVASLDIADRVRFVPPGSPAEIARFMNALDARVMMPQAGRGIREPFDRFIAETQACGVPIIASSLSGMTEMVGDGGWIVDEGDAGMLSRLLRQLAEDPAELEAASRACIQRVERRFSLEMVTHDLYRAFTIARQNRNLRKKQPMSADADTYAIRRGMKP